MYNNSSKNSGLFVLNMVHCELLNKILFTWSTTFWQLVFFFSIGGAVGLLLLWLIGQILVGEVG